MDFEKKKNVNALKLKKCRKGQLEIIFVTFQLMDFDKILFMH